MPSPRWTAKRRPILRRRRSDTFTDHSFRDLPAMTDSDSWNFAPRSRADTIAALTTETWDLVVIGGGATGLGTAMDAASRGYRTLLLEGRDFAKATSSRSTKLIHGGVRYLRQGNLSLVRESLRERELLLALAPKLVRPLEFVIPATSWLGTAFYATGLKAYDFLAGSIPGRRSRMLGSEAISQRFPTLKFDHYAGGGVAYHDAQFDDARLAIAILKVAIAHGAFALNDFPVTSILKDSGRISGVVARDEDTSREYQIRAKSVINATGIFTDSIREMDDCQAKPILRQSQGAHIVVDRAHFPAHSAVIVPETDDGRVLFFIPWHDKVLIGTTDVPVDGPELEPRPGDAEVDYLLDYSHRYLATPLERSEIRSSWAGLRPLVSTGDSRSTSKISRDHHLEVSDSGLITIAGGKWTTFRTMGEDAVNRAISVGGLAPKPCCSDTVSFPVSELDSAAAWDEFPQSVVWKCVHEEFARTVEDVLARRSRVLFLDAKRAIKLAPQVAQTMAPLLEKSSDWIEAQISEFTKLAQRFLPAE
ncbi:MAG: glycerol-3-phosphate dehydrogenase/oxidase [Planctomycetaceae bacterium]|nr:glycerol-3-phosphate dehydrogenase/oxidase [Planctomycetaceae bacterium]